jgi:hypothetical protein
MSSIPGVFCLCASAAAVAACATPTSNVQEPGPAGAGTPAPAEACAQELGQDAPDSFDGAPALDVGTHGGCYGLGDRADTFTLSAPAHNAGVLYRLEISGHASAQACLEIFDASRAVPRGAGKGGMCADNPGAALRAWAVVMGGTQWFLRVRDLSGSADREARSWNLTIGAEPLADPAEPDGDPAAIKPLALGQPQTAYFVDAINAGGPENDTFALAVPARGKLTISLQNGDPSVQFTAAVVDAAGKEVVRRKAAPNPGANLEVQGTVNRGPHLVRITNLAGSGTPPAGRGEPPRYATAPYTILASQ